MARGVIVAAVFVLAVAGEAPAFADSWFGRVDLVESTAGRSTRFFVRQSALSLFARGDSRAILLSGFYSKATMSVGYKPISCPGGISGRCGRVNFVSVERGNNF